VVRVAWLTDIHLNFLNPALLGAFLKTLQQANPDVFLISGDIGEALELSRYLQLLATHLPQPVYFVLGNHDFYYGSIDQVRREVDVLAQSTPNLTYLSTAAVIELTPTVGLVGHDGWADLQHGDFARSSVWMNDYNLIFDLMGKKKIGLWPSMIRLGEEAAAHLGRVLPVALERYPHVYVVTHVPPFKEACWHEGRISDDEWLPHFTCKAVGDMLLEIAGTHPQNQITVLCGHTHGQGEAQILPNLRVHTGGAEYGQPRIQAIFELV
jgi:Icc protein